MTTTSAHRGLRRTVLLMSLCALLGSVMSAPAAHAATSRNGVCESGEFCYYYGSDATGSTSDFAGSLANYGTDPATCYVYKSSGTGQGQCIKNNARSVVNRSSQTVRVYYNSSFAGTYQDVRAGTTANLNASLARENASHEFRSTSTGSSTAVQVAVSTARAEIRNHPLYAWGGGHGSTPGATRGFCDGVNGYLDGNCVADDRIGFDCSGLMRFAFWKATGSDWGNKATTDLYSTRPAVFGSTITSISSLRVGDLLLIKNAGTAPVNHTAIVSAVSGTTITVIEAANTRSNLREASLVNSTFVKAYRLR